MSYNVYRVSSAGLPRDHHAIFVDMNDDLSGWLFQVTGNIQNGMKYDHKPSKKPEESGTYQSKIAIGTVATADFARIKPTCESIPAPKKQFEGARRLYPKEPLRRCQEWTQEAIDALVQAGILKTST
ncbi:hypothetical protein POX_f07965 [Penicillium oxalicum]|uniref:Uncharacterized protein n=1 Tax=Penicillium oxalicum (strain 114-2 / CGMCC 5302) TaxID=933388 RepID=S8AS78_PENO1|nr:hypothetical protein POX_f07965 [Penicillium oxalicum]EPS28893.1 hypothetical protein PDE_03839 [Penicillium oxalicum 114-2]KAI2787593.1 hypothetical protein POX_f07965 [Penicillium oxalicum]